LALTPKTLARVFFSDSGSTSVEVAIKMAVGCWHNRGRPRHGIIALEHSYHGDMFGAMSVGQRGLFNAAYEEMLFDVSYLPFPAPGSCIIRTALMVVGHTTTGDGNAGIRDVMMVEPALH